MKYLIVTLSQINETIKPDAFHNIQYYTDSGNCFFGKQTNEAPTKYFIHKLAEKGELLDKIIVLVSDECMSLPIPAVEENVTYDYYKRTISEFLCSTIQEKDQLQELIDETYAGQLKLYLESVFCPVSITDHLLRSIVDIICESNSSVKDQLYLDFTGGSRVTSLISLLLARILESTHAEIKQIVYGDILKRNEPAHIRDCTQQYDLLTVVENISKAQLNPGERNRGIMIELVNLGLIDNMDDEVVVSLDGMEAAAERNMKSPSNVANVVEGKKIKNMIASKSGLTKKMIIDSQEATRQSLKVTEYTKYLTKPTNERLIVDFYESFLWVFINDHVIINGNQNQKKDDIKNALDANNAYYYGQSNTAGKKVTVGLLQTVTNWCQLLYNAAVDGKTWVNPSDRCRFLSSLSNPFYEKWRPPYYPKRINMDKVNAFLSYLEKSGVTLNKASLPEMFKTISKFEMLYYNYAFPFMCCGVGFDDSIYPDIYEFYRNTVRDFFEKLEQLKNKSFSEYKDQLFYYINTEGALESALPYMIKQDAWSINGSKFENAKGGELFVQEYCARMAEVRPYRNAIAHKLANEYSDPEKQRQIAEKIKQWVREYEERFSDTKGMLL